MANRRRRFRRPLNSRSAVHGEPATAFTRCTVSGSQSHASSVATTVIAAAAQSSAGLHADRVKPLRLLDVEFPLVLAAGQAVPCDPAAHDIVLERRAVVLVTRQRDVGGPVGARALDVVGGARRVYHRFQQRVRRQPAGAVQAGHRHLADRVEVAHAGPAVRVHDDAAAAVVRRRVGLVAAGVAEDMVVYLRRSLSDPELSPFLINRRHPHAAVHRVQDAICAEPERDWNMPAMAAVGHVTERHLLRLFVHHAGVSPLKFLRVIRLERARQLIERGTSVTQAAEIAGFRSDLHLRRAWSRQWGGSPRDAQKTAIARQRITGNSNMPVLQVR